MNGSIACPLCQTTGASLCATVLTFRVRRCARCSLEWIDRQDLAEAKDKVTYQNYSYNQNLRLHFEKSKPRYVEGLRRRLSRTLGLDRAAASSFLDVGCANGEYLWAARELGFRRTDGVEIDAPAADRAATYGTVVESVERLDSAYDVIQIKNVISNIEDFVPFVRSYVDRLNPGGWLFLDVLNQRGLTARLRILTNPSGWYGALRPPYVINGFNRRALLTLFDGLGLEKTYLATFHAGSVMLPYTTAIRPRLLGSFATLMGRGPMLISESRRGEDRRRAAS